MRILLVHQFLWSHYKAGIFNELEKLFHQSTDDQIHIIQTAKYEKSRLDFGEADTTIHKYKYELLFDDIYENTSYIQRVKAVVKRIQQFKPDVINLPGYYEPAMVTVHFIAKAMGIKVILSNDSTEGDNPNKWYTELIKRFIITNADGFFCYGKLSADYMLKLGAKENEILMRRNSVNNDLVRKMAVDYTKSTEFAETKSKLPSYNFIYVGRFLDIKNIPLMIRAFQGLQNAYDWGLILVGDGPLRNQIRELAKKDDRITIYPPQAWSGIPQKLALADILILPSYSEPWGLVTNEAMICNMPVIVSEKAGSAADLVKNGINGFTFDAYSENELKARMQFFIDSPDQIENFGNESAKIINEFSPEKVAKDMFNGFKKVSSK